MSFRAYLESNPVPANDETLLLAGTSAIATGNYAEGAEYLDQVEADGALAAEAWWHLALIDLREGNFAAARDELKRITQQRIPKRIPAMELLDKIPQQ